MRNFLRDSLVGFRNALEKGVATEPPWHIRANNQWVIEMMSSQASAPAFPMYSSFEQAEQQPGNLLHWEHTYGLQLHPGGAPYQPWTIELARVSCGQSETAVIKSFEQFYQIPREEQEIPCCPPWWGNPFLLWPAHIRWHFRVQPYTGDAIPQWSIVAGTGELPGDPHRETPVFEDLWFPAGSPASQNIHITVGSRQLLRVLGEVPAADVQPAIAAKIRGFRFRAFAPASVAALKTIW
jgi:hypothetical protein